MDILFAIENECFREPLEVWVKWECPFLPRIGEYVNPWIWIDENLTRKEIEKNLTQEGEEYLAQWEGDVADWLYEVGIGNNDVIKSVGFWQKENSKEVYALLRIGTMGK